MLTLLLIFFLSGIGCLLVTPGVSAMAVRHGLVDRPDGRRKMHGRAIPLGGGLAILGGASVAIAAAVAASPLRRQLLELGPVLIGLLVAALIIAVVGLIDDYRGLRGRHKLLGQIVAVVVVINCGVVVKTVQLFGQQIDLGLLSVPFTVFLLLAAINALNLLDGMDGLLSCVGAIICLAMAGTAVLLGHWAAACLAAALAGALIGFLRYNFPPASIFMGDCGSMLVGLVIGVLAIQSSLKGPATVALAAPLAVLTIPLLDTTAAILRRKLTGRSIYLADRSHLHHCLLRRGLTARRVLAYVSLFCLATLLAALASVALHSELLALLGMLTVGGILITTRLFGYTEFVLLKNRIAMSLLHGASDGKPRQSEIRLQGSADWATLWFELTTNAEQLNLKALCLDINAPSIHEGYLARWDQGPTDPADVGLWRAELPLVAEGQTLGRLEIVGHRDDQAICSKLATLARLVEDIELGMCTAAEGPRKASERQPDGKFLIDLTPGPSHDALQTAVMIRPSRIGGGSEMPVLPEHVTARPSARRRPSKPR